MAIREIEIKCLTESTLNVRKSKGNKQSDKALMASIEESGVLQNLVVVPNGSGKFEVVGGGRRLQALKALVAKKKLMPTDTVLCLVKDGVDATLVSMSENIKEDMHPADWFEAYKKLADQGKSVDSIANAFGRSKKEVVKLLKLAAVSPEIISAYRSGKIGQDCVMAYAIVDDVSKQMEVFSLGLKSPHRIKSALASLEVSTESKFVKLVSLRAYKQAGGIVVQDMFEEIGYIQDVEVLMDMVSKSLAEQAELTSTEGWLWVESDIDQRWNFRSLVPVGTNAPAEYLDRISSLKEKIDGLDDDSDEYYDLADSLEELEDGLENFGVFSESQKAVSGVHIFVSEDGTIGFSRGKVRSDDLRLAFPEEFSNEEAISDEARSEADSHLESSAHVGDLVNFKSLALQAALVGNTSLCNDMLSFSIALSALSDTWDSLLNISTRPSCFENLPFASESEAHGLLEANFRGLELSWLEHDNVGHKFSSYRALSINKKQLISNYCVARCLALSGDVLSDVKKELSFNILDYWRPTVDNYFGRVQKKGLLKIASAELDEDSFALLSSKSKKEISIEMAAKLKDYVPKPMN